MRLIPQAPQGKTNVGLYLYVIVITLDVQKPRFLEMPALLTCTVSYFYGGYIIANTGFLASQLLSLCIFKSLPTFDLANFWSPLKLLN